jgi:hypothetical protein
VRLVEYRSESLLPQKLPKKSQRLRETLAEISLYRLGNRLSQALGSQPSE